MISVAPGSMVVNPVKVLLPVKMTAPVRMSTAPLPLMAAPKRKGLLCRSVRWKSKWAVEVPLVFKTTLADPMDPVVPFPSPKVKEAPAAMVVVPE